MTSLIKLNGHYNKKVFEISKARGIKHFGFDFRPRSFNFLQNYKFIEILDSIYHHDHFYYLIFERETDNVLNLFIADIKKIFASRGQLERVNQQVFLEFTDTREKSFYNNLELGFFWRVENELAMLEVLKSDNLQGLILSFDMLEKFQKQGQLFSFIGKLNNGLKRFDGKVKLALDLPWHADIFPSLFEFMNFDYINLTMGPQVEEGYRNVDEGKLISHLKHYADLNL